MNLNTLYKYITPQGDIKSQSLSEMFSQSEKTLLYVYPRDNTPGCTLENKSFSCLKTDFEKQGIALV